MINVSQKFYSSCRDYFVTWMFACIRFFLFSEFVFNSFLATIFSPYLHILYIDSFQTYSLFFDFNKVSSSFFAKSVEWTHFLCIEWESQFKNILKIALNVHFLLIVSFRFKKKYFTFFLYAFIGMNLLEELYRYSFGRNCTWIILVTNLHSYIIHIIFASQYASQSLWLQILQSLYNIKQLPYSRYIWIFMDVCLFHLR